MTEVENHYQNLSPLQADLEVMRTDTTETNRLVSELEAKLDHPENRSRRNNLIFYNLPDPNPAETNAEAEGLIIRHCLEHLQVAIDPKEIDRAHRLGRHAANRRRPIIAKFTFHKTKETIYGCGPNWHAGSSVRDHFLPITRPRHQYTASDSADQDTTPGHSKNVKRAIATVALRSAIETSCTDLMATSFNRQITRLRSAGCAKAILAAVSESLLQCVNGRNKGVQDT
ncbi:hypothetical protein HPB48_001685 [Haemaphysalis longicornis]|uniref:Uncharacterized protein n=1 Tax=Haemaphysalis longicornis TaxID=44386 RepID=A0A9J6GUJ3_HAELO|nr:hypothetical protein HPB48_001685 [Haemaphysalis longicornis]